MQVIRKTAIVARKTGAKPTHSPVSTAGRGGGASSGWPSLKGHWVSSPRLLRWKFRSGNRTGGKVSTIVTGFNGRPLGRKEGILL